jgi:hypothetical protein
MKKTLLTLFLVAGFICGWAVASVIAHRNIERIKEGWSPEFQQFVSENAEFVKSLTKEEIEQLRRDIHDYKNQTLHELEIRTLYDALLAIQIQAALSQGNTNRVQELLEDRINDLREAHAEGRFKGKDGEGIADSLVRGINNQTNLPFMKPSGQ